VAASLADGIAREGRVILGGDLSFNLSHREVRAPERAFLDAQGHHCIIRAQMEKCFELRPPATRAGGLKALFYQYCRRRLDNGAFHRSDFGEHQCRLPCR
jgi:hypothetical protein